MSLGVDRLHRQLADAATAVGEGKNVRLPEAGLHLWATFVALHRTRSFHSTGPNPITYAEIDAYCRCTGELLRAVDVAAIRAMDDAWLVAQISRSSGIARGRGPALTPEAFDARIGL